jgi:monoamine oxidase
MAPDAGAGGKRARKIAGARSYSKLILMIGGISHMNSQGNPRSAAADNELAWTQEAIGPATAYDGIIIGAGQHGLVLGAYLARAGLNILLVERRLNYGGGLCTREVTRPGFYHNLHSINHFHISETPWFRDLGLADKVTYITPRYEFGQAHRDGTALVLGRDLEETVASIARFSRKDAQTFRDWNRKAEAMTAHRFPDRPVHCRGRRGPRTDSAILAHYPSSR